MPWAVVVAVAFAALTACTVDEGGAVIQDAEEFVEDARRRAREAAHDVEEAGEQVGARAVAEAIRAALIVEDLETGEPLRDIDVLHRAVDAIPGAPQVSGIEDADGDGRDDDGRLEVAANDELACVSVPAGGGDIDVRSDAC